MVAGNTPQFARKSSHIHWEQEKGRGPRGRGQKGQKGRGKRKREKRGPVQGRLADYKHYIHHHRHNLSGKAASSYKYPTISFL